MKDLQQVLHFDKVYPSGRIYTKEGLPLEVFSEARERALSGKMFGQIGYSNSLKDFISPASHKIVDLFLLEDGVWADIEILDNDNGKTLEFLIDNELIEFKTSCRGDISTDNKVTIKKIITIDAFAKET